jgi:hypothetical protein
MLKSNVKNKDKRKKQCFVSCRRKPPKIPKWSTLMKISDYFKKSLSLEWDNNDTDLEHVFLSYDEIGNIDLGSNSSRDLNTSRDEVATLKVIFKAVS